MPQPIVIAILTNASQANSDLDKTATTAQRVGAGFRKMALPSTLALGALTAGAKSAVDAASDLNEEVAKSGQVFGDQAKDIQKFAADAEQSLGQSEKAALAAASTFGQIGQKAGLSNAESVKFSKTFVGLASDLASFNNTSPEQAIEAIGSAMRGEAEPIRKYGVLLDDATLRNRALKLGLIDNIKTALTPQQKALAASKEILAQTSKAQGDFARTSDGAANKSRILAAEQENLRAKIGQDLLPVYVELQKEASKVIGFMSDHTDATKVAAGVVAGLAVAVIAVNTAMTVGGAVIKTYTALTTLASLAQEENTKKTLAGRGAILGAGAALLYLGQSGKIGNESLSKVATVAGAVASGFALGGGPFGAVVAGGAALLTLAGNSEESARRQQAFLDMQTRINGQAKALTGTLNEQTGAITSLTRETIAKSLADNGAFTAANKVGVSYATVTSAALGNKAAQAQVNAATDAYIAKQVNSVKGMDEQIKAFGRAREATGPLTTSVNTFSTSLDKAKTATAQAKSAIAQMEAQAKTSAKGMKGAGSDAGEGFHTGLSGWLNPIRELGKSIAAIVEKAARDKLKVKSPSLVFREIGQFTGEGFILGIQDKEAAAKAAMYRVTAAAIKEGNRAAGSRVEFAGFDVDSLSAAGRLRAAGGISIGQVNITLSDSMSKAEKGREVWEAIEEAVEVGLVRR